MSPHVNKKKIVINPSAFPESHFHAFLAFFRGAKEFFENEVFGRFEDLSCQPKTDTMGHKSCNELSAGSDNFRLKGNPYLKLPSFKLRLTLRFAFELINAQHSKLLQSHLSLT